MADKYGVTPTGFKIKTRDQIVADMQTTAKSFFGDNVNISSKSPLGLFIQLLSWPISLVWKALEDIYNSAYVDTATGQSLDNVGKYIGAARREATKAIQVVGFTGIAGTNIPLGFIVETGGENQIEFETIETKDIPEEGYITLKVSCTLGGAVGNVPAGTITVIKNPTVGINSVSNQSLDVEGIDRETDQQFRERYRKSVAKGGASTLDSITAAILEVDNVMDALVIENDTNQIDSEGRSPKSVNAIVLGGDELRIAEAIFNSKAAGIETWGDTSVNVYDRAGLEHAVKFSRAIEVPVYITISVTTNSTFPLEGFDQIKDQVIQYIGGIDSKNVYHRGLTMGETVVYMAIPMMINVPGVEDLDICLGKTPNPTGKINIPMESNEKAVTDLEKVVVS